MKQPEKRINIYKELKKRIAAKEFYPGLRLPKEIDMAKQHGVARETLRSALSMLEDEGLIERFRNKGTFITKNKPPKEGLVTFLLPCPNFLTGDGESQALVRDLFHGSMQAACELNWKLDIIPVSPTNNPDDINWEILEYLDSNNRIVLCSWWYRKIFHFLHDRQCRVSAVFPSPIEQPEYSDILKSWNCLVYSFDKATLNAVNYLTQCGCNKIALAGDALKDRFNGNSLEGYINGIKTIPGMPRDGFVVDKASETSDDFLSAFARLHQKTNFDGLVFDVNFPINYSISLNRNLAIPESVKIITLHDFGYNRKLRPQVSASVFSFRQFGYDAVMALADDNSPPIKKFYDALIVERESTTANKLIQAFSNSTNGIKENSEQFSYN